MINCSVCLMMILTLVLLMVMILINSNIHKLNIVVPMKTNVIIVLMVKNIIVPTIINNCNHNLMQMTVTVSNRNRSLVCLAINKPPWGFSCTKFLCDICEV